ncbi:hypothetical protein GQ457_03G025620 [Hibiscus cannabinus]
MCSNILAEVWSIHNMLLYAWRLGFCRVELETDCVDVERILKGCSVALPCNSLVDVIRELLACVWVVVIRRIPRKMHKVVDALAASIRDEKIGVRLFDSPPDFINSLISENNLVIGEDGDVG